jgi:hypothetical protein
MAIAINVRAHGNSGREVEQLWDQVAAFEDEPSMRTLGYRPHFTFAIYDSPAIAEETAWQAMLRAAIDPAYCRPHYRPGRWTPHCTLGTRITEERHHEAIDFAGSFNRSMTVLFDVADCVVFPPVRVVAEQKLPAGAR